MRGRGRAWQGVHGGGCMHGGGLCVAGGGAGVCDRRYGNCSGRYASYWNAFLLQIDLFQ